MDPYSSLSVHGVMVKDVFWYYQKVLEYHHVESIQEKERVLPLVRLSWVILSFASLVGFGVSLNEGFAEGEFSFAFLWLFASVLFGMVALSVQEKMQYEAKHLPYVNVQEVYETTQLPSLDVVDVTSDISRTLSLAAQHVVQLAFKEAHDRGHQEVTALHVLLGLVQQPEMLALMVRMNITVKDIQQPLLRQLSLLNDGKGEDQSELQLLVVEAFAHAISRQRKQVDIADLLAVVYKKTSFVQDLFYALDVTEEELGHVIDWSDIETDLRQRYQDFRRLAAFKPTGAMNKAFTSVQTKFLDSVAYDLTRSAVRGRVPLVVGRKRETDMILRAIEGGRQSVVLVGESGVGKEAIIGGIAQMMVEEHVPEVLKDKRLLELSLSHVLGSGGGAHAQERLLYALQEVARSGNIILVIKNIDQLSVAHTGGLDLASILAGELEKGYTFVIGTTSPDRYTSQLEGSVLGNRLEVVAIDEPSVSDAIRVLEAKIGGIENTQKVIFTYDAVAALVQLSDRYLRDSFLPDKAIRLAKEVALFVHQTGGDWSRVEKEHVAQFVSDRAQVKVTQVTAEEGKDLLQLEQRLHERVIGQDQAVKAVASALRRSRAELRSEGRPIASFLFLGPTGVGKTELAKTTAEVYFGSENSMVRLDMSEYQDAASVERLIGGAQEKGYLTESVRKNPFTVLLLDELEKAHPDILNLFLQVMEDGRLTDGTGRTIDFTNVILIATSNAGTSYIFEQTQKGVDIETIHDVLMESQLQTVYRPEFLNRFDGVMVFKPLSKEDVVSIAYLMIVSVKQRLEAKGIQLEMTDAAIHELAGLGYDPQFGARPLRRVIQEKVDNAVADILLSGQVQRRDKIVFDEGGKISIQKAQRL